MDPTPSGELFLIWREPSSRAQYPIGELSFDGDQYRFSYDAGALRVARRHGFSFANFPLAAAFPEPEKTYTSTELFPAIAHRLPDPRRPDYERLLARLGLSRESHPFQILRKTRGRLATDELSFEEAPTQTAEGLTIKCYVSGWRFYSGESVLKDLAVGESIEVERDQSNRFDPHAVKVCGPNGEMLGFIPVYHSSEIAHALSTGRRVTATITEINPPPSPTTDRLQLRIVIAPRPHAREKIRRKLAKGELPRVIPDPLHPTQLEGFEPITIGPGDGQICSGCDEIIGSDEHLSIEFRYATRLPVRFHHECFEIWNELRRLADRQAVGARHGMTKVFVCHAHEDKDTVARPIAEALREAGLEVWFDEFSLRVGDSIRQRIEEGLASCNYGVVVLSAHFFAKNWPQAELDALLGRDLAGAARVLPVWHDIEREEVERRAPILAGRFAARSSVGLDRVVELLLNAMLPDDAHRTMEGLTVSLEPKRVLLAKGMWRVKSSIRLANRSRRDAYSVWVKISPDKRDVESDSIEVEMMGRSTALRGQVGRLAVSADSVRVDCVDASGREAVFLMLHSLEAGTSRELILSGTTSIEHGVELSVSSFSFKPAPVLEQPNRAALPLIFPEAIRAKSVRLLFARSA